MERNTRKAGEIMKSIYIILFISILLVIISGSIGSVVEKSGINGIVEKILKLNNDAYLEIIRVYNDFVDKNFKPPNYDVRIIDVTNLKDCFDISLNAKSPCILVNFDIKNNQNDSLTFEITGRTIVTKDGKQFDKYGGLYNTKQMNGQCYTENFFKLFPNDNKKVGVCFPVVSKNDGPVMYIGVKANGKEKEHNFDLASNLS
jgi:hypothetical protein